ncbi:probable tRNA pseudouridine synthase 2 [Zootermopsis nevadensis]|uniref:Putative tRNA pseudouridine synthase 2 n=1 Tax=Zootermopsis nevadensis TaxID=136037 RepID=A0A067QQB1_ZOONE|nr:probable tRNA pseudouridine synthase 2 [Zootermopsis nevadensis]KDR11978.1 putative tRNA pseudouridine synthase 2 [Zootermopsis nevadensis]
MVYVSKAPTVWNLLKGVVCIYKPAGITAAYVRKILLGNICRDLCELETRPPASHVFIEGNPSTSLNVHVSPSFADHPLVVGPRYQPDDFRCTWGAPIGKNISGVFVLGLNEGNKIVKNLHMQRPTRVFRLKGLLGQATDTYFSDGKVVEKATFRHVNRSKLDTLVASIQAAHQKQMFHQSGVDIQSQTAYELAVQGLIKPANSKIPILYGIKCIHFEPPNFTIEVQCINEHEVYLKTLVHDIGMKLHSVATCTSIQCIRYDSFTLEHALLRKHWTLQHLMDSMSESSRLLKETEADKRQKSAFLVKSDMSRLKAPVVNNDEIETLY